MSTHETLRLAPDGDQVIKAGTESPVTILVQSALLKAASPVFRIMLSSGSIGAASYQADNPLLLPDEDGPAFPLLCRIVHHMPMEVSKLHLLPDLIVVADKYECLKAIKPEISAMLIPYFNKQVEEVSRLPDLSLIDAMCIALLIGDARLFWRTSQYLVVGYDLKNLESEIHEGLLKLIPETLPIRIRMLQCQMRSNLFEALDEPEDRQLEWMDKRPSHSTCDGHAKAVGRYRHELSRKGIRKKDAAIGSTYTILGVLWDIVGQIAKSLKPSQDPYGFSCGESGCPRCPIDMSNDILKVLKESKAGLRGLCLDCELCGHPSGAGRVCHHSFDR